MGMITSIYSRAPMCESISSVDVFIVQIFCIPSIPTSIQFSVYKLPYECGNLMFTIIQDISLISYSNFLFSEHYNLAYPISYLTCQIDFYSPSHHINLIHLHIDIRTFRNIQFTQNYY